MKLVQGGLLVAIGLGILWLAVTGRLNRVGDAWRFLVSGAGVPGLGGGQPEGPKPPRHFNKIPTSAASFGLPDILGSAFN